VRTPTRDGDARPILVTVVQTRYRVRLERDGRLDQNAASPGCDEWWRPSALPSDCSALADGQSALERCIRPPQTMMPNAWSTTAKPRREGG
jgi:hypothetical protein